MGGSTLTLTLHMSSAAQANASAKTTGNGITFDVEKSARGGRRPIDAKKARAREQHRKASRQRPGATQVRRAENK